MKRNSYKSLLKLMTISSLTLIITSCAFFNQTEQGDPGEGGKINIDGAVSNLDSATGFSFTAQESVTTAQAEIVKAKIHAKEIESLVEVMRRKKSEFAENIENLRQIYVQHITVLDRELRITGNALRKQIIALKNTEAELLKAKAEIEEQERHKAAMTAHNKSLSKKLKEAEGYKDKYHKLTKYKWIVWGLGAWILVKFLGGLGAWSPQGRIARALIG
jgi:hypothetical protein